MFTKVNRITKTVRIDAELSTMENVILDTAKYSEFIGSIERVEMLEESESFNKAKFFARLTIPFSYVIKTEKLSSQTFRFEQTDGFFSVFKRRLVSRTPNGLFRSHLRNRSQTSDLCAI